MLLLLLQPLKTWEKNAQVIGGFDFAASQVYFDGHTFQCTYIAMLALHTGIIPLDVSRTSASWPFRLRKYGSKGFVFLALGLAKEQLAPNTIFPRCIELSPCNQQHARLIFIRRRSYEHFVCMSFSFGPQQQQQQENKQNEAFATSGYADDEETHPTTILALAKTNIKNVLKGKSILVTGDIETFVRQARGTDIEYPWPIFLKSIAMMKESGKISDAQLQHLYGPYWTEVSKCCREGKWHEVEVLTKKRIEDLQPLMIQAFRECESIHWSICQQTDRDYGAFNPQKQTAREFYGPYYNGAHCTYMWPQKMTIIRALRNRHTEPDCLLVQWLPKDLIKLIFLQLDKMAVAEILNKALN